MKYVIIGNSIAATACIEGIRSQDNAGEITVISGEDRPCYGRPLISYYLLGRIKKENTFYRPSDFYESNGVTVLYNTLATSVDPVKKRVALSSGEEVEYDKLLVATGSRPFVPPMEGLKSVKNAFSFMTMSDAEALEGALDKQSEVLIIGAGLIGLKCAEGIAARVKKITVVDMADRILPSVLDGEGAAIVQKTLEAHGAEFILNDSVAAFKGNCATLKSGREVKFDILVVAVGVRANTELVSAAGGKVNRGIVVDECMRTSLADVYAAGDCTEGYDKLLGANRVLALLPNANFQGRCAGVNMAGGKAEFRDGMPMNSVGFFDCHVVTAGIYEGQCIAQSDETSLKKLYIKDGKLVGFIIIGDIRRAGIYTSLIRNGTPLSEVDEELLFTRPQLSALSAEARKNILTKAV
ncbi:MAG: NAD(P)/FAD-dependent oxidoreductase [Candidatus Coproplasma sp.]